MNRQQPHRSGSQKSRGGNPQSDRAYGKTETGVHKSRLGGANRQAGSSRNADTPPAGGSKRAQGGGKQQDEHSDSHQSSDSASQSGATGTDETPGE